MQSPRASGRVEPALVAFAALLAYGVTLWGGLFFGDVEFILNRRAFDEMPLLELAFGHGYWLREIGETEGPYYRPLVVLLDGLCRAAFGAEPLGYHAVNLTLHVGASLLVYRLARALDIAPGASRLGAQLFAVHPLMAHAVAYVSGHGDVLMTLFALGAALGALRYGRDGEWPALLAAVAGFALALLSKGAAAPMAIALPAMVAARGGGARRAMTLAGAVALVLLGWAFARASVVDAEALARGALYDPLATLSWYVEKLFLPRELTFLPPFAVPIAATAPRVLAGGALAVGALVALFRGDGGTRVGLLIAGAGFVPASGFFLLEYPVKGNYAYLPMVGVALLVALSFARLGARAPRPARHFGLLLIVGYGALGFAVATTYHDEETVVSTTLAAVDEYPSSFFAGARMEQVRTRYSIFALRAGHAAAMADDAEAAALFYARAIELSEASLAADEARYNLGHLLVGLRRDEEARPLLEWSLERYPERALPATDLAVLAERRGDREALVRHAAEACARGNARACALSPP